MKRSIFGIVSVLFFLASVACGQDIYVVTPSDDTGDANGAVGEYDSTSGAAVNFNLAEGLQYPNAIALSGSSLFVTHYTGQMPGGYSISEYDSTSGAILAENLVPGVYGGNLAVCGSNLFFTQDNEISEYNATAGVVILDSLNAASSIAVSGSNLFVIHGSTLGEYTTTGGVVSASLVNLVEGSTARGLVLSGSDLFVTEGNGTIGEYTTSGAVVNASLVSGLNAPTGIAIFGSDLFVANPFNGTISEYTTSGALVNASLVSGLNTPLYIAVSQPVPEPSTLILLVCAIVCIIVVCLRQRSLTAR